MGTPIPRYADYPALSSSCPECGHNGPHTVQHNGYELEFSCEGCGMQFEVPASYRRRVARERRTARALSGR